MSLADFGSKRLEQAAETFDIDRTFDSHEALSGSEVDPIAIFILRNRHGPAIIEALEAGKHLYSAVPIASSLEEIAEMLELVADTGLVYMNGETIAYYPHRIYCQQP